MKDIPGFLLKKEQIPYHISQPAHNLFTFTGRLITLTIEIPRRLAYRRIFFDWVEYANFQKPIKNEQRTVQA